MVYDASAKSISGPSLNDCLLRGPKFNQLIFDFLVQFCSYRIALTADLEKAFLMVAMEEADQDVLRFVWVDDVWKNPPDLRVLGLPELFLDYHLAPFCLMPPLGST